MKARHRSSFVSKLLLAALLPLALSDRAGAAVYEEGDVVGDFTLMTRRAWTNDAGQTIAAGSPVRLSDFAGKIVFLEFFAVW